jgi:hypothetical protein
VAQEFRDDEDDFERRAQGDRHEAHDRRGSRGRRGHDHDDSNRWPTEAPSVELARVVLQIDRSVTLKRTAAAAWLTSHAEAVPSLPIRPTRMELAILITLAETYGARLYREACFLPVIDFIADYGAVLLVQRVMYGAQPVTDFDVTAYAAENARLADLVRDARVVFEFLCATWPEVFLAQTHAVLAGLGVHVRPPDVEPMPPLSNDEDQGRGLDQNEREKGSNDDGDHNEGGDRDDEGNDDSASGEGGDA